MMSADRRQYLPPKLLCVQCGEASELTHAELLRIGKVLDLSSVVETFICGRCVRRAAVSAPKGNGTPSA